MSQLSLDLSGEMFWVLEYGPAGVPISYWPIPPQWVAATPHRIYSSAELRQISRSREKPELTPENAYSIVFRTGPVLFGQWEVIWSKDPNPLDPYGRGSGIGMTLGDEIETDEYAAKFLKSFFLNSARPELIIGVEGASKPVLDEAAAQYNNQFGRFWNSAKTWWHSGKVTVQELTGKIRDMQMVELRKAQRDVVGITYGVPPEMRGITENANRATITVADYIYQSQVVVPRLELLRSELQAKLIPLYDDRYVLDYVSPIPEDKELQLEFLKASSHSATRGEWRRAAGLVDRGEGDNVHHTPTGLVESSAPRVTQRKRRTKSVGQIELFGVHRDGATLGADGVDDIVDALSGRTLTEHTLPTQTDRLKTWGDVQMDALGVQAVFNIQDPVVQAFLLDFGAERIKLINDETKQEVRETLLDGVQRGEGHAELSRRVSDVMGIAKGTRTNTIARTEAKRAANFGRLESFKQSGVVEKKKWHAQMLNTRKTHVELAAGAAIGVNELFAIGNDRSGYPGGFALPENSINCQCYMTPVLIELKAEGYNWNGFDEQTEPWMKELGDAFVAGFNEQEKDVLKALDEEMG
jgi:hypothetical protein